MGQLLTKAKEIFGGIWDGLLHNILREGSQKTFTCPSRNGDSSSKQDVSTYISDCLSRNDCSRFSGSGYSDSHLVSNRKEQDTEANYSASKKNLIKSSEVNERKESVTRKITRIKHYCSSQKILLVGEGDFSFSACLANAFGYAANMFATSLDSTGNLFS